MRPSASSLSHNLRIESIAALDGMSAQELVGGHAPFTGGLDFDNVNKSAFGNPTEKTGFRF